jgi:acyl-CoA thioesterase
MASLAKIVEDFDPSSAFNTPSNWFQGRTVYGGLAVALALQAARRDAPPDLPPLKSAQVSFVGPAAESLRFRTQTLRQGKSATFVSVDCLSGSDVAMRVAFVFATPRSSKIQHNFSRFPSVGAADNYKSLGAVSLAPAFLANFDIRFAGGSLPISGSDHPEFIAWVRHLDASGVAPEIALIALGDSLPLAAMACFTEFAPISTMTWTLDLLQPAMPGEWFLLRSASQRAGNGYSFQTMEIWNKDGKLVLSGTQTVAIFT